MPRGSKPGERRGGRTAGTPNKATLPERQRILAEADPIGKLIAAANTGKIRVGEGDGAREIELSPDQWLGVLRELRRIAIPDAKSSPVNLDLPEIKAPGDLVAALGRVVAAMTGGALPIEDAAGVAGVLELKRRAIETEDHERRLVAIEATQGGAK